MKAVKFRKHSAHSVTARVYSASEFPTYNVEVNPIPKKALI
ncbi:hypothetical protein HOV93_09630 [Planctomycetes bacterium FF15]|uniref:Uncharacterized protein n=1 Tax=Bremerella alba TaxID=980252 RepID=A0A7V9A6C8_9BACT|nr:hypothetical protein [Bremerella alba]